MHRMKKSHAPGLSGLPLIMGFITALSGCHPEGARPTLSGAELYVANCKQCHGATAQGQQGIATPAIAGLASWYIEGQLVKFRTGVRGAHPEDYDGLRMRPMSMQLMNNDEVKAVSTYLASLTPMKQPLTVEGGDATAGAGSYAVCLACHGPDGKGNPALKSPSLVGQHDWYLLSQLKKFKAGIRGTNPKDITGGQMRPMSMTLADEQAMKNVLAHISTLAK